MEDGLIPLTIPRPAELVVSEQAFSRDGQQRELP